MRSSSRIHKKIIFLRNLLFLYYDIIPDDIQKVYVENGISVEYYYMGAKYIVKNYPWLHTTVKIEGKFCDIESNNEDKKSITKSDLTKLNGIYNLIKNDKSVLEYIKEKK